MKVVVFSDVHGNLPAFETMLKHAGPCDQYICLGDLVNYGPWSNECVDLALSLPSCRYVMGNHEEAFIKGCYEGNNALVKSFFSICSPRFTKTDQIARFPKSFEDFGYTFCHTIAEKSISPDTNIELDANYVIGHSHHQFVSRNSGYTLFNTGSVGQNRKYGNIVNYITIDLSGMNFSLISVPYNMSLLISEMKHRGFPSECVDYYLSKELA